MTPSFPSLPGHPRRSEKYISQIVVDSFLKKYQTVSTAARHLNIDDEQVRQMVASKSIEPIPESYGVPIYYRSDLLG